MSGETAIVVAVLIADMLPLFGGIPGGPELLILFIVFLFMLVIPVAVGVGLFLLGRWSADRGEGDMAALRNRVEELERQLAADREREEPTEERSDADRKR